MSNEKDIDVDHAGATLIIVFGLSSAVTLLVGAMYFLVNVLRA